jgi:hypothetical protein
LWKNFRQKQAFRKSAECGQAILEFTLGLLITLSFFFFYVKLAAVFAIGNYIHYATFMASRAYSASNSSQAAQTQAATQVMQKMLGGRWKNLIKPTGGDGTSITGATIGGGPYYSQTPKENAWNQGVTFTYQSSLSFYPASSPGASIVMKLTSESWMLREQSDEEVCNQKLQTIQGQVSGNVRAPVQVEWDNGC